MDHLDETMVALFVERKLPADRATVVEEHIDRCAACRELVAVLGRRSHGIAAGSVTTQAALPPPSEEQVLAVGERVGRYVVLGALGRGGMGAVYAAFDPDLDRKVALKLLRRTSANPDERARLLREAQALARISHPGVVAIHDVGTFGDQVFLAMEFISGGTLRTWLTTEDRGWRDVIALLGQVARGLAAAHASGLVHRDVKPDNILVDDAGRARIGDFGLAFAITTARRSDPVISDSSKSVLAESLTVTGAVVGTPAYMAPEQLSGHTATARSDQFSLCVTLYEAIHGVRPYAGGSLKEIDAAMRMGTVSPPKSGLDVPVRVRDAIMRGLAIDPAARHPSIDALIVALEREPRSRRRIAALAAAGVIAVGGAGSALWMMRGESAAVCGGAEAELAGVWDPARRATLAGAFAATKLPFADDQLTRVGTVLDYYATTWVTTRTRACEDTRVRKSHDDAALALRIDCLGDRKRSLRALVDVLARADRDVVEHAVDAVAKLPQLEQCDDLPALRELVRPPADPVVRAEVDRIAAELAAVEALRDAGKSDATLVAKATTIVGRTRAIDYPPIRARALFWLGIVHDDLDHVDDAERAWREAITSADLARDDRLRATTWSLLVSLIAMDRGKPDDAATLLPQAEAAIARVGPDDQIELDWLGTQANLLNAQGKVRESAKLFEQIVARREQASGGDDPSLAMAISNLAVVSEPFVKPEEALALARRAVAIFTKAYGPKHPDTANAQHEEAVALIRLGEFAQAATLLEQTIVVLEGAYGPDAPSVALSLVRLASAYRRQKRLDDAAPALERALAIRKQAYGDDHYLIAEVEQQLALVANARGDHARSIELHRDSIRIIAAAMGPDHPFIGAAHFGIGQALKQSGKLAEALVEFERAHAIEEKALGKDSPQLAESLTLIGGTKIALDDAKGALPYLERALALRTTSKGSPVDLAKIQLTFADALRRVGQRARARTLAEQARDGYAKLGDAEELAIANKLLETLK